MKVEVCLIRHHNTVLLRNKFKTISKFAESIGKENNQVSSWMREKSPRLIGDVLARDIEASSGKPLNWLDQIHSEEVFKAWELKFRAVNVGLEIKRKASNQSLGEKELSAIEKIVKNA